MREPRWDDLLTGDPERIEHGLDEWVEGIRRRADRMREIRTGVDAIRITETGGNGAVTVTVDANGLPVDLRFTERVRNIAPDELGHLVMRTLRTAQARIAQQVREVATTAVGDDLPETREMLVDSYRGRFGDAAPPGQPTSSATDKDDLGDESYLS